MLKLVSRPMWRRLWTLVKLVLFLMLVYSGVRILFYAFNSHHFAGATAGELVQSFLLGLKFDVSVISLICAPFFLFWLFPSRRVPTKSFNLFLFIHVLFLSLNIADIELEQFNGRRLTPFYFLLSQDISDQLGQLMVQYWYLTFIFMTCIFLLWKMTPRIAPFAGARPGVLSIVVVYVPMVLALFWFIRGGAQARPLREANAFVFSSPELGNLALNSSFTFVHGRKSSKKETVDFLSQAELQKYVLERTPKASSLHGSLKGSNVVLIVMESFAREFMGKVNGREGYTPFLDELAEQSLFFKNAYANGHRSIDSMPSLLAGLPALAKEPFLLSGAQNVEVKGFPRMLKAHGYSTSFFHGAKNGTMFFDAFMARVGMDNYFGLNEYPSEIKDRDYDGYWGIWDEPYFQYVAHSLEALEAPFFVTAFSLSAHQPFDLPAHLDGKFPKGSLDIHPTVAYSDQALRKFFETVKSKAWYKNTLFIVTADHTTYSDAPEYQSIPGSYRIPILFFHPGFDKWPKGAEDTFIHHADIMPTAFDLLGVKENLLATGRSVFSDQEHFAAFRTYDDFWHISDKGILHMNISGKFLDTYGDPESEFNLKAYVQYMLNGVLR